MSLNIRERWPSALEPNSPLRWMEDQIEDLASGPERNAQRVLLFVIDNIERYTDTSALSQRFVE